MKKALTKSSVSLHHYKDRKRVEGANKRMTGDCSELEGNCTGLRGNCTGLRGDCSGLWGDLDECDITDEERKRGVDISDLVS